MSRSGESNLRPSAYQPSALPPGQAGSQGYSSRKSSAIYPSPTSACWVFSCFRNPSNSDMEYRIFNVRTWTFLSVRYTQGGLGTPTTSQHTILTRKNCDNDDNTNNNNNNSSSSSSSSNTTTTNNNNSFIIIINSSSSSNIWLTKAGGGTEAGGTSDSHCQWCKLSDTDPDRRRARQEEFLDVWLKSKAVQRNSFQEVFLRQVDQVLENTNCFLKLAWSCHHSVATIKQTSTSVTHQLTNKVACSKPCFIQRVESIKT